MGKIFVPGSDRLLEMRMIGTILSSMAFSIAFILAISCLVSLVKSRNSPHSSPLNFYYFSTYVITMLSISIFSITENALSLFSLTFYGTHPFHLKSGSPVALPLAIWGADGVMVSTFSIFKYFAFNLTVDCRYCGISKLWRCMVLYQDVPRLPRLALRCLIGFLAIKVLGMHSSYKITA